MVGSHFHVGQDVFREICSGNNGDPIIACQTDSTASCAILGFFWCQGPMGSYEQHEIFLHPYLEAILTAAVQAAPWTTIQPRQPMKFPQPTWKMPSPLAPIDLANLNSGFSNNGSPKNMGKSSSSSKCDSIGCTVCINGRCRHTPNKSN
uniref:Uncharacterized protein n=1 Tax=Romanomermis culicivorax TaxID=13658 RepID=A0A915HRE2_ROMCU